MSALLTKGRSVVLQLVLAGALWFLSGRPWTAETVDPATQVPGVAQTAAASGETGHPLLTAAAAVLAVSSLLLAMLSRVGRYVVLGLTGLTGLGALAVGAAAAGTAPAASVWPTVAVGALTVVFAVCAARASGSWQTSSRYERSAAAPADPEEDPTAAWDALSRGEDPS
jgi:hypothetical protein